MTAPLRVAHVALQLETGGLERLLVEFARCADRSAVVPTVLSMGQRGALADEIESHGCPVIALGLEPGLRPSALFRIAKLLRERGIDVVHTHNTKPLLYAGPAARLAGVRAVIHTRHGQRHGATRRQNALFRLAACCADRMVCVSEDSQHCCLSEGIDPARVRVIPNGIDIERFSGAGCRTGSPALYVGRLTPEKDVATLVRATALVVRSAPLFRLRIVGDGPCKEELLQLTSELGLAEHVEFLGRRSDVHAIMAEASLFVLSSRTEGVPLTVLEAMASGLPVVATDVGGTSEAVKDGVTGTLVPACAEAPLATAILAHRNDPHRARSMGEAGRDLVRRRFDVRSMVAQYEAIYRQCARKGEAAAA
jgi:glycosyltransferase involved in cell wall biosynthesis